MRMQFAQAVLQRGVTVRAGLEQQQDLVRELPGETGVIDIGGFLGALRDMGYDGPVTPEPFKRELQDLPSDAARLVVVKASMDAVWKWAGWR